MSDEDWATVQAMYKHGGSFVHHLAYAAMSADEDNYARLKAAFPEIWAKYGEMAKRKEAA